jgi:hypothetical protein
MYTAWDKAFPASNKAEEWNRKVSQLEWQAAQASVLYGDERIRAYQAIQKAWADMESSFSTDSTSRQLVFTEGVTNGFSDMTKAMASSTEFMDVVTTTTYNMYDTIQSKIMEYGQAIVNAQQQSIAAEKANAETARKGLEDTTAAILVVRDAITMVESTITTLDTQLAQQRVLSIDTSGAMQQLARLISMIASVNGMLGATGGAITTTNTYIPDAMGSYATGTDYVPKTGLYMLHEGEAVIPKSENTSNNSNSVVIGDIHVYEATTPNATVDAIIGQIEKKLFNRGYLRS